MQTWAKQKQSGFTIVELLIVIVVIGILAAITIVAYNGIQNMAKLAVAQADLASSAKSLEASRLLNAANGGAESYPATLNDITLKASNGVTYTQYIVNNTMSPPSYCLTATKDGAPYSTTNGNQTAQAGTCVANMVPNPSLETNTVGWGFSSGTSGVATASLMTNGGAIAGSTNYYRLAWTTAATVGWGGSQVTSIPVETGKTYSASAWVRVNRAQSVMMFIRASNYPTTADATGPSVSAPVNGWVRVTATFANVPSGVTSLSANMQRTGSGNWMAGDTFDTDALIFTEGTSAQNYADGETSNWVWTGTKHLSTSFGPSV